ncbi:dTDP-4-dehydrorhamnose reductase [Anaerosinus massiliensis]|uniref:dTDP-4-dehydrorhamnose reductase n=1 Tax=Massilibacillus massiliensis TaxID=1806837 RepID=UPI000AF2A100|nr:dTDP-4-dehydrorhamnose reductase [Massilibacillus massiliensis]
MKIVVTGANGQLGREVATQGKTLHELILVGHQDLDIGNSRAVKEFFMKTKPDAVINCAAYTNVDHAETDFDGAFRVNVIGVQNLAAACLEIGAKLVHVSTDYVFDGSGKESYREYETVCPLGVYGKTKWIGEQMVREILGRHFIVRTAWLYGDGNNFVRTMLRLAESNQTLRVVNDQIGTPTSTVDVTKAIFRLLESNSYGTYHATCRGKCSWYDFAVEIFKQVEKEIDVVPVTSEEFSRPAKRPAYSVLDNYMLKMTVGDPMRDWQTALKEYLHREGKV